jgi:cell division protein FtsL
MNRVNALLLAMLVASSLVLVKSAYDARRLFAELDRERSEQRRLDLERERMHAERQAQATHLRVEQVAREKLLMRTVTPAVTQYVTDPGAGK